MNFSDQLIAASKEKNSHVCVGLDPRIKRIPTKIFTALRKNFSDSQEVIKRAIISFNRDIIDAVKAEAAVVKIQLAFYEIYGAAGFEAAKKTAEYAKSQGLAVIIDGKRNDIGSTAKAYAQAYLGGGEDKYTDLSDSVSALTVNPYLGSDGIQPFIDVCKEGGKGSFVLVKTSNPSSGELQDLKLESDDTVYETVAKLVAEWGKELIGEEGYSSLGAVVAATYPEMIAQLREIMKNNYFLVPGFGAQGGGAEDIVNAFNDDGLGAVINSSRGINFAYQKPEYSNDHKEAANQAAKEMRYQINQALEQADKLAW